MSTDTDTETPETHDGAVDRTASVLTPYRGQPVMAAGIAIPNAAGGLQSALAVDPVELDIGSVVFVVLECEVRPPQYDPIDKANNRGPLRIVNRLHANEGTFVDEELVREHLDRQKDRIAEAESLREQREREAAGEQQLPLDEDGEGPDAARGGEPATAGDVLDDVLGMADEADADVSAREAREDELDAMDPAERRALADRLGVTGLDLTEAELVEAMIDAEQAGGDA